MNLPIDRPSPVAIARALCALSMATDELPNYEKDCLEEAFKLLSEEPPNIAAAKEEIADGVAHAFRPNFREDARASAWIVAACAEILSNSK